MSSQTYSNTISNFPVSVKREIYYISSDKIKVYTYENSPEYEGGYILGEIDLSGIDISRYQYLLYKHSGYTGSSRNIGPFERYIDLSEINSALFYTPGTGYVGGTHKFILEGKKLIFHTSILGHQQIYPIEDFRSAIPYFALI